MNLDALAPTIVRLLKILEQRGPTPSWKLKTAPGFADALVVSEDRRWATAIREAHGQAGVPAWIWRLTPAGAARLRFWLDDVVGLDVQKKGKSVMKINLAFNVDSVLRAVEHLNHLQARAEATWPEDKIGALNVLLGRMARESDAEGWLGVRLVEAGTVEANPGYKVELLERILTGEQELPPGLLRSESELSPRFE